jgi:outer membrane protein assembly factor BamA
VTIENCRIFGNGLNSTGSNISLYNDNFHGDGTQFGISANLSHIIMRNVTFSGFSRPINNDSSVIEYVQNKTNSMAVYPDEPAMHQQYEGSIFAALIICGILAYYYFVVRRGR